MYNSQNIFRQGIGEATILPQSSFDPASAAREMAMMRKQEQQQMHQAASWIQSQTIGQGWERDMEGLLQRQNQLKEGLISDIMSGKVNPEYARGQYMKEIEPLAREANQLQQQKNLYLTGLKQLQGATGQKLFDTTATTENFNTWASGKTKDGESLVPEGMSVTEWREENMGMLSPIPLYRDSEHQAKILKGNTPTQNVNVDYVRQADGSYIKQQVVDIDYRGSSAVYDREFVQAQSDYEDGNENSASLKFMVARMKEMQNALDPTVEADASGNIRITFRKNIAKAEEASKLFEESEGRPAVTAEDYAKGYWLTTLTAGKKTEGEMGLRMPPRAKQDEFDINRFGWDSPEVKDHLGVMDAELTLSPDIKVRVDNFAALPGGSSPVMNELITRSKVYYSNGDPISRDRSKFIIHQGVTEVPIVKKEFTHKGKVYKVNQIIEPDIAEAIKDKEFVEYRAVSHGLSYPDKNSVGDRKNEKTVYGDIDKMSAEARAKMSKQNQKLFDKQIEYMKQAASEKNNGLTGKRFTPSTGISTE